MLLIETILTLIKDSSDGLPTESRRYGRLENLRYDSGKADWFAEIRAQSIINNLGLDCHSALSKSALS